MKMSKESIRDVLRFLVEQPKLTVSVASIFAQIYLFNIAPQLINEPGGAVVFIATFAFMLISNSWLVSQFDTD